MKPVCIILFMLLFHHARAQLQNAEPDETEERNLEDLTESAEAESEDEYYLQQMLSYKNHPLNINGKERSAC